MAGAATQEAILALNAGSSSLKFALYAGTDAGPEQMVRGEIVDIGHAPRLMLAEADRGVIEARRWPASVQYEELLGDLVDWIERHQDGCRLRTVGHRVVHGGSQFVDPVRLTPEVIEALRALTPLAPLHQPLCLAPIDAIARARPTLTQIACFDTAFHHRLQPPVSRYAIPLEYEAQGVRRYGFHGLSYEYIAHQLEEISPHLKGRRTVVAHLGSGASLCAMRDGCSVDTTMGFSVLDGLVMATRSGAIDPGILLFLLKQKQLSAEALEDMLYHKSGLLGVSGISGDMRALLASADPSAREAVELFVFRLSREIAAMANSLGGIEALIFTGGIGEHTAPIRAMTAERLRWLGVIIDSAANEEGAPRIDLPESLVEIRVIPTNEELTIARHVAELV